MIQLILIFKFLNLIKTDLVCEVDGRLHDVRCKFGKANYVV